MESHAAQPEQPPKEAAYTQAANPVSHKPQEQRTSASMQDGNAASSTRRTAYMPSNDETRAALDAERKSEKKRMQSAAPVDLYYGVEQQPAEGDIADAVKHKGMGGFGEQEDLAADMDQKRAEHDRILSERAKENPHSDVAEREAVRQRKLRLDKEIDVEGILKKGT
ncbi:hypothetical protein N7495_002253 [Penicillium taxi]|uniref:uncharacterized protein n=1 Tax=Penicillium taxi TaxID=168475 RepID=UPI0025455D77|nr:uncharacterized protein N7495_002253 [Penicillium taxi]KAJ5901725.1 hypothetical protein N7495_002253 [Penicillium taxi]